MGGKVNHEGNFDRQSFNATPDAGGALPAVNSTIHPNA